MNTAQILIAEGIVLDKECIVCYEKFINIKNSHYTTFLSYIKDKYKLNKRNHNDFECDTTCLCYDDRFECLTCKNIVCRHCIMNMPDYVNGKRIDSLAMYMNRYEEVFKILDMDDTGIVTCPICRTKDYRDFYTNNSRGAMPEEILYDIKKRLKY